VNFEVSVWMADPWMARPALSKLNRAIWDALQAKQIVIAFPQMDLHLDPPVVNSLQQLASAN
jgi:small-conductance mechanosensitive channel